MRLRRRAVGQLYGLSMHSERPRHRMYEQWHPLGVVGVISSFNFPVSVWSWNAAIAAVCGDTVVWKPSSHTPLTSIAVQHICNHVMSRFDAQGVFRVTTALALDGSADGAHVLRLVAADAAGNAAAPVDFAFTLDTQAPGTT